MVGIDHELELLGVRAHIAPGKGGDDAVRRGIVHAREDVQIPVVISDADFCLEARLLALVGVILEELVNHLCRGPSWINGASVEHGWDEGARGAGGGGSGPRAGWRQRWREGAAGGDECQAGWGLAAGVRERQGEAGHCRKKENWANHRASAWEDAGETRRVRKGLKCRSFAHVP